MDAIGFRLNSSQTNTKSNVRTNHYFFETFNFFEKEKVDGDIKNSKFLCFDMYGEKMNVRSLLDLQTAFFENISQLK
jgi:hypothetical protein